MQRWSPHTPMPQHGGLFVMVIRWCSAVENTYSLNEFIPFVTTKNYCWRLCTLARGEVRANPTRGQYLKCQHWYVQPRCPSHYSSPRAHSYNALKIGPCEKEPSTSQPDGPLQIPKPLSNRMPHPPKGNTRRTMYNPNYQAAQNYSIV